ncbi:hypothetical protein S83_037358 [Arachis hypogaea]
MSTVFLHRRRDPFEHGLLPIPKPIFSDPAQTLISLKQKILELSSGGKVDAAVISESLQNSLDHARLVLETLSSVSHLRIPSYPPPKSPSSTCRNCCCSCTFNPTRGSWRAPRRTPSPLVTSGLPPPPSMATCPLSGRFSFNYPFPDAIYFWSIVISFVLIVVLNSLVIWIYMLSLVCNFMDYSVCFGRCSKFNGFFVAPVLLFSLCLG